MTALTEYTRLYCRTQRHFDSSDIDACLKSVRDVWTCCQNGKHNALHMYIFIANQILAKLPESRTRAFLKKNPDIAEHIAELARQMQIADAMNTMALASIG